MVGVTVSALLELWAAKFKSELREEGWITINGRRINVDKSGNPASWFDKVHAKWGRARGKKRLGEQAGEWVTINGKHVNIGGHEPQGERLGLENLTSVALSHDDLKLRHTQKIPRGFNNQRGRQAGHKAAAKVFKSAKSLHAAARKLGAMHHAAHAAHQRAGSQKMKMHHAGFKEAVGHHLSNVNAVIKAVEQKFGGHRGRR